MSSPNFDCHKYEPITTRESEKQRFSNITSRPLSPLHQSHPPFLPKLPPHHCKKLKPRNSSVAHLNSRRATRRQNTFFDDDRNFSRHLTFSHVHFFFSGGKGAISFDGWFSMEGSNDGRGQSADIHVPSDDADVYFTPWVIFCLGSSSFHW